MYRKTVATLRRFGLSYQDARHELGKRSQVTLCNNTTVETGFAVLTGEDAVVVRLHGHAIYQVASDGRRYVRTCGWNTVTTRSRLNALLADTPCRVASVKGEPCLYRTGVRVGNVDSDTWTLVPIHTNESEV